MKLLKYILLFIFSLLLNRNVSATEIVVVKNESILTSITNTNWNTKLTKLSNDLANAPPAFKNKILNNLQFIEAWEIVRRNIDNFGVNTTKFALDADVLDKMYDLMKGGSNFRTKMTQYGLNWEGGILYELPGVKSKFETFALSKGFDFQMCTIEDFLIQNDDWFELIFKTDLQ